MPTSPPEPRRRRKWDATTPVPPDAAALAAAAAANLSLRVNPPPQDTPPSTDAVREFEINDNPGRRYAMMSANLKAVEAQTDVVIVSKGRYYGPSEAGPPPDALDADRKLFLKIKGKDESSVEEAVKMLEGIMRERSGGVKREREVERVWCDMDVGIAPQLEIVKRLKGIDGEYLDWIEQESGAKIVLSGRGSGEIGARDNLHFAIRGSPGQTGTAKGFCYSIVRTVQGVYGEYVAKWYGIRVRRGGGGGTGRGGGKWLNGGGRSFDRPVGMQASSVAPTQTGILPPPTPPSQMMQAQFNGQPPLPPAQQVDGIDTALTSTSRLAMSALSQTELPPPPPVDGMGAAPPPPPPLPPSSPPPPPPSPPPPPPPPTAQ